MNETGTISLTPTSQQSAEIEEWLFAEDKATGEGFYCNWGIIAGYVLKKQAAVITVNGQTVGFTTWQYEYTTHQLVRIGFAEIHPSFRRKGLTKQLISAVCQHLADNNVLVVDLQCSPASSEPAWRAMGFTGFPNHQDTRNTGNKELFRILVPSLPAVSVITTSESIELWDKETHLATGRESTWKWDVIFQEGTRTLQKPIIHPCNDSWQMRWTKDGQFIKEIKVARFDKYVTVTDSFLIITQLPEID